MKFLQGLFCAFGLLASANGLSWKLDASCRTNELGTMISAASESAFSMAAAEYDVLNKILSNQDLGQHSADIRNVIKWMFMKDGEEPNRERLTLLKTRMGTLARSNNRQDNETPDGNTIIIYCGFERFTKRPDGRWYDEHIQEALEPNEDFDGCKGVSPTVAYTWVPDDRNKPSQVQICPWFINWMQNVDTDTMKDAQKKAKFYEKVSQRLAKMHTLLTPIDVESLLDKVILHELTHTRPGGQSEDVDGPGFLKVRYGWNRCRKLAQEGSSDPKRQSQVNADSIALAGSAIRFINEGKKVKENGDVE